MVSHSSCPAVFYRLRCLNTLVSSFEQSDNYFSQPFDVSNGQVLPAAVRVTARLHLNLPCFCCSPKKAAPATQGRAKMQAMEKLRQRLIALSSQPQHVDSRLEQGFRLANSVELIKVRPCRGAFGVLSKDLPAIRHRNTQSSTRSPSSSRQLEAIFVALANDP